MSSWRGEANPGGAEGGLGTGIRADADTLGNPARFIRWPDQMTRHIHDLKTP